MTKVLLSILFHTSNRQQMTASADSKSIMLQRVPSTSATGTGSTQFFVWRVKNIYREHFMDHLYHAALNLRQMVNYMAELLLEVSYLSRGLPVKILTYKMIIRDQNFN